MMWYRCKSWIVLVTSCVLLSVLYDPAPASIHDGDMAGQKHELADSDRSINLKQFLSRYLGIPYLRGGSSLKGFDCSGFARFIYKTFFDFDLPHNSTSQYRSPLLVKVPHEELKPGDLIFFASSPSKKRINHVGIYLEDNTFIHAENKRGITLSRIDDAYWRSRLVSVKRPLIGDEYQYQDESDFSEPEQNPSGLLSLTVARRHPQPLKYAGGIGVPSYKTWLSLVMLSYTQYLFTDTLKFSISRFTMPGSSYRFLYTTSSFSFLPHESAPSGGYNFTADFVPFHGLCISPFLTLHDRHYTSSFRYSPAQTVGFNIWLFSSDTRTWSLAATMQQSTLATSTRQHSKGHEGTPDWSLTYQCRLSEVLHLSCTGEYVRYPFLTSTSDSASYDQRFFFQLRFSY